MKKRILLLCALLFTLLLTGCAMRTVEEMYALPKRSEEYKELQAAIDTAMYGMTFSSPQSGENQQTVQMADLNGDGLDEYLVFAKGATEKPLQVLIFQQMCQLILLVVYGNFNFAPAFLNLASPAFTIFSFFQLFIFSCIDRGKRFHFFNCFVSDFFYS